jgi:hypothetical protein
MTQALYAHMNNNKQNKNKKRKTLMLDAVGSSTLLSVRIELTFKKNTACLSGF